MSPLLDPSAPDFSWDCPLHPNQPRSRVECPRGQIPSLSDVCVPHVSCSVLGGGYLTPLREGKEASEAPSWLSSGSTAEGSEMRQGTLLALRAWPWPLLSGENVHTSLTLTHSPVHIRSLTYNTHLSCTSHTHTHSHTAYTFTNTHSHPTPPRHTLP